MKQGDHQYIQYLISMQAALKMLLFYISCTLCEWWPLPLRQHCRLVGESMQYGTHKMFNNPNLLGLQVKYLCMKSVTMMLACPYPYWTCRKQQVEWPNNVYGWACPQTLFASLYMHAHAMISALFPGSLVRGVRLIMMHAPHSSELNVVLWHVYNNVHACTYMHVTG